MNDDNYLSINDQGLAEVSPTASRDQQMAFIDNFRQAQGQNNQQIADSIHALGSDLEAPYGGLHGPSDYIKSRYQTPQTESRMAGLRTTAQLAALNQLMQNDLAKWKNKYNQESRNYNKRQRAKQNASSSGGGTGGTGEGGSNLNINTETGVPETIDVNTNPNTSGNNIIQTGKNTYKDLETGEEYSTAGTAFMSTANQGMSLGVWPNGSRMTEGSTYTAPNGNTYIYKKVNNTPTPNVYLVGGR